MISTRKRQLTLGILTLAVLGGAGVIAWRLVNNQRIRNRYRTEVCVQQMERICSGVQVYFRTYETVPRTPRPDALARELALLLLGGNPRGIRFLSESDFANSNDVTLDPWGTAFSFAFRRETDALLVFEIGSQGADPHTTDDDLRSSVSLTWEGAAGAAGQSIF